MSREVFYGTWAGNPDAKTKFITVQVSENIKLMHKDIKLDKDAAKDRNGNLPLVTCGKYTVYETPDGSLSIRQESVNISSDLVEESGMIIRDVDFSNPAEVLKKYNELKASYENKEFYTKSSYKLALTDEVSVHTRVSVVHGVTSIDCTGFKGVKISKKLSNDKLIEAVISYEKNKELLS